MEKFQKSSKTVYYELLRIIAVILVIYNHLDAYYMYKKTAGLKQALYMVSTMITRINVPLFLMISGALLLGKKEEYPTVLKKRVKRFVLVLLIFEAAMFCCYKLDSIINGYNYRFTLKRFFFGFLEGDLEGTGSYWYLYSFLGYLMTLPFLQRIAGEMKREDFYVLTGLHFVFSTFLPILNLLFSAADFGELVITGSFSVPLSVTKALFYPLTGYYIDRKVDLEHIKKRHIAGLSFMGAAGILLSCLCTLYQGHTTGKYTQNYVQLFDYLTAITVFFLVKYIMLYVFPKLSKGRTGALICFAGSLTFGIYLLDPFLKLFFYQKYEAFAHIYLPVILVSAGWIVISCTAGGMLTWLLKKLPGMKKLI